MMRNKLVLIADDEAALALLKEFVDPQTVGGRCTAFQNTTVTRFESGMDCGHVGDIHLVFGDSQFTQDVEIHIAPTKDQVREVMDKHSVLMISGTPRAGKTYVWDAGVMYPEPPIIRGGIVFQFRRNVLQSRHRDLVSVLHRVFMEDVLGADACRSCDTTP